jgi:hypothetical protein
LREALAQACRTTRHAPGFATPLFVEKEGFVAVLPPVDRGGQVSVKMNGNTEFDVQLQRR